MCYLPTSPLPPRRVPHTCLLTGFTAYIPTHNMQPATKRSRASTSACKCPKHQVAHMTCRGRVEKQRNQRWQFCKNNGMILHDDNEDNDKECNICYEFYDHHHPTNRKAGSLDKAKSAHSCWFCQNLASDDSNDSAEHQELAAKTRLKSSNGFERSYLESASRPKTCINIAENMLEAEQQQKTTFVTLC